MGPDTFYIDADIEVAETLPARFYRDNGVFDLLRSRVFYRSWQLVGNMDMVKLPRHIYPTVLLDGFLTEPLLLTRDEGDEVHCLSNVCTHRGNIVAMNPGVQSKLVCGYHGRKFRLDGSFESMPSFKEAKEFPRACDDLHTFETRKWGPLIFAKLGGEMNFDAALSDMDKYVGFLPMDEFSYSAPLSKDYLVNGHWALYCDNFLEGFHIPFVHKDLNEVLDYGTYETVLGEYHNLQIGFAEGAEDIFSFPKGHIHYGKRVGAYYFWVFPNMMFNFYPWGMSVNLVQPVSPNQTKVSFFTYVYDSSKLESGAGALLDKVEREDEFVVENVHKGLKSRYYRNGRFSPTREKGVHHFHRLLCRFLQQAE